MYAVEANKTFLLAHFLVYLYAWQLTKYILVPEMDCMC